MFYGLSHGSYQAPATLAEQAPVQTSAAKLATATAVLNKTDDPFALRQWPGEFSGTNFELQTEPWSLTLSGAIESPPIASDALTTPEAKPDLTPQTAPEAPEALLITKPLIWGLRAIRQMPKTHQHRRIVSQEGWTYRSEWQGVLFQHLLTEAKPTPQARYVLQQNAAGEKVLSSIQSLVQQEALLALSESGEPLTALHGGPIKLMVFDRYHQVGLGQLTHLHFLTQAEAEAMVEDEPGLTLNPDFAEIAPGRYYAFDLKNFRSIEKPGEVRQF